jgi:hypothetical protein
MVHILLLLLLILCRNINRFVIFMSWNYFSMQRNFTFYLYFLLTNFSSVGKCPYGVEERTSRTTYTKTGRWSQEKGSDFAGIMIYDNFICVSWAYNNNNTPPPPYFFETTVSNLICQFLSSYCVYIPCIKIDSAMQFQICPIVLVMVILNDIFVVKIYHFVIATWYPTIFWLSGLYLCL